MFFSHLLFIITATTAALVAAIPTPAPEGDLNLETVGQFHPG